MPPESISNVIQTVPGTSECLQLLQTERERVPILVSPHPCLPIGRIINGPAEIVLFIPREANLISTAQRTIVESGYVQVAEYIGYRSDFMFWNDEEIAALRNNPELIASIGSTSLMGSIHKPD